MCAGGVPRAGMGWMVIGVRKCAGTSTRSILEVEGGMILMMGDVKRSCQ